MADEATDGARMTDDGDMTDRDQDAFDEIDDSTVHHVDAIDLRSLGVVAVLFYLTAFLVLALAIVAVWLFAASLGLISQLEEFMRSIGFRGFRLVGPEVIIGFVLILAALVVFLTVMTLVAAAFYNLLGMGKRGVRIRTSPVYDSFDDDVEDADGTGAAAPVPIVTETPAAADESSTDGADEAPAKAAKSTKATKATKADGSDDAEPDGKADSEPDESGADEPAEKPTPKAAAS